MKKTISLLLIALLLLSLCACGGKTEPAEPEPAPAPAEEPAPAEPTPDVNPAHVASASDLEPEKPTEDPGPAPVMIDPPAEPEYPMIVPMGETVFADLDGDGTEEKICVSVEQTFEGWDRVKLMLNGVDCTDKIYVEGETWFDCPDPDFWAITDVYSVDNLLEIAIQDWGPSDDYYTNFFRFEGGIVYPFGGVQGMIWKSWNDSSDLSFEEDGFVHSYMRLNVLQTWYADVRYEIAPRGVLDVVPQELYYATHPTPVTLLKDLRAYDGKGGEEFIIDAGVKMNIVATDNAEWIYGISESEDWALWFHLNPEFPFEIETIDGYVWCCDAMDGLLMAD